MSSFFSSYSIDFEIILPFSSYIEKLSRWTSIKYFNDLIDAIDTINALLRSNMRAWRILLVSLNRSRISFQNAQYIPVYNLHILLYSPFASWLVFGNSFKSSDILFRVDFIWEYLWTNALVVSDRHDQRVVEIIFGISILAVLSLDFKFFSSSS